MATSLIQLLCRMTKLGWFEDDAYRVLADEARNFLEKGTTVRLGLVWCRWQCSSLCTTCLGGAHAGGLSRR